MPCLGQNWRAMREPPNGQLLVTTFRDPRLLEQLSDRQFTEIISLARRELVLGHLADAALNGVEQLQLPERRQEILASALQAIHHNHCETRWEVVRLARLLEPIGCKLIILKGSAYVLAGGKAGGGRASGDLDIMVPHNVLAAVEAQLIADGWQMAALDPYDIHYYRTWMHELPPFHHPERSRELDVHHTILPRTARLRPQAEALVAAALPLGTTGAWQLCPADQLIHSALHLFYDGDLTGGLRNLHDIHRLIGDFAQAHDFWDILNERVRLHGVGRPMHYALQYSSRIFGTIIPPNISAQWPNARPGRPVQWLMDKLVAARLLKWRIGPPSPSLHLTSLLLYIRSHWLKMPPQLLARHLLIKAGRSVFRPRDS